jgi:hypothetical protein
MTGLADVTCVHFVITEVIDRDWGGAKRRVRVAEARDLSRIPLIKPTKPVVLAVFD